MAETSLPSRMFSTDSPKAIKAQKYGYLNAILYLAPHTFARVGNLCPKASPGCIAACLGLYSGQAAMVAKGERLNSVRTSRIRKAQAFMQERAAFMRAVAYDIARNHAKAARLGLQLAVRLNGSTDIAWEGISLNINSDDVSRIGKLSRFALYPEMGAYRNIFELFPSVQFLDYTKLETRTRRALPSNYHLTFSRSESNSADIRRVLDTPHNIAVVFETLPDTWEGREVIDGDAHDLRFLDPSNVIVGLTPKGLKAKRDASGFIVRTP